MEKIKAGAVLLICGFAANVAMADGERSIEVMYGQANQKDSFKAHFGGTTLSGTSNENTNLLGVRAAMGLSDGVVLEIAYINYGEWKYSDSNDTEETSSISVGAVGSYPFSEKASFNLRCGISKWQVEFMPDVGSSSVQRGIDLYYGVGVDFRVAKQLKLSVEYTLLDMEYDLQDSGIEVDVEHDIGSTALSIGYIF
ncbi:MAG: hypothetical protein COA99_06820 [Moraxellaceae bacterium]|nr:MAG: hypothetical protein COA99_06820 [Moraxellaceae bacterium]